MSWVSGRDLASSCLARIPPRAGQIRPSWCVETAQVVHSACQSPVTCHRADGHLQPRVARARYPAHGVHVHVRQSHSSWTRRQEQGRVSRPCRGKAPSPRRYLARRVGGSVTGSDVVLSCLSFFFSFSSPRRFLGVFWKSARIGESNRLGVRCSQAEHSIRSPIRGSRHGDTPLLTTEHPFSY